MDVVFAHSLTATQLIGQTRLSQGGRRPKNEVGAIQRMISRGPWKLCHYDQMRVQLFNLEEDPLEHNDRWDDPACSDIITDLTARLLEG